MLSSVYNLFFNCQMELASYNHATVCDYLSWLVSFLVIFNFTAGKYNTFSVWQISERHCEGVSVAMTF